MQQTDKEIEDKARSIYLSRYGSIGGKWELVDTKEYWINLARLALEGEEGTRR